MSPIQEIHVCRDVFIQWLDDAIKASKAIPTSPDLRAARLHAAERWGKVDEIMGSLCRRVASECFISPEDAPNPEGLEHELKQLADRDVEASDPGADRADYNRKLRLVSEEMDA
jgi:hypothetical protein